MQLLDYDSKKYVASLIGFCSISLDLWQKGGNTKLT